jgi:hypothetical protein
MIEASYQQTIDKYLQSSQSNRPDLVQMPEYMVQTMVDSRSTVPVEACLKSSGYDTTAFLPTLLDAFATQGVEWAMPFNISNPVLFYNKKMFAAAGLDPEKPPVSLDDVRADSEALVNSGAAKYGVALDSNFDSGGGWYLEQWFANMGELYADNGNGRLAPATRVLYDGPAGVQKAWDYAMAGGRVSHGRVIVEGFIDFDYEITQLTVRALAAGGQVETHFCDPIGHVQVSGDYVESWQPHPMTPAALARSREIAKAVTDNLGGQGLFGVELFVKGDMVWFSEVSPRPHDTGMVTMITQWQNEFELHARAILGLPVDTALKSPGASAVIYGGVEAKGIVFDGVADAMRVPNSEIRLFGKPESFTKRRMGVALVHDQDVEVARTQAKLAASKVKPRKA